MGKGKGNNARGAQAGRRKPQTMQTGRSKTRRDKPMLANGLGDERDLKAQLASMGLYAANTLGDGNCLFRALSDQLYGAPNHHLTLRSEVCDYLAAHKEKYAAFVDDRPFEDYVRVMRESGTYGGHLELSAFAHLKGRPIKVIQPQLVYVVSGIDESPSAVRKREDEERRAAKAAARGEEGTRGKPLSSREQRKKRREESAKAERAMTAGAAATTGEPAPVTPGKKGKEKAVDASDDEGADDDDDDDDDKAPVYIAYHNWEHYSSVRNVAGPHVGLPKVREQRNATSPCVRPGRGVSKAKAAAHGIANGRDRRVSVRHAEVVSDSEEEWDDDGNASSSSLSSGIEEDEEEGVEAAEPQTDQEKIIMASVPGHGLSEVRRWMTKMGGDADKVIEVLIERDRAEDVEAERAGEAGEASRSHRRQGHASADGGEKQQGMSLPPPTAAATAAALRASLHAWRSTSPVSSTASGATGASNTTAPSLSGSQFSTNATSSPEHGNSPAPLEAGAGAGGAGHARGMLLAGGTGGKGKGKRMGEESDRDDGATKRKSSSPETAWDRELVPCSSPLARPPEQDDDVGEEDDREGGPSPSPSPLLSPSPSPSPSPLPLVAATASANDAPSPAARSSKSATTTTRTKLSTPSAAIAAATAAQGRRLTAKEKKEIREAAKWQKRRERDVALAATTERRTTRSRSAARGQAQAQAEVRGFRELRI